MQEQNTIRGYTIHPAGAARVCALENIRKSGRTYQRDRRKTEQLQTTVPDNNWALLGNFFTRRRRCWRTRRSGYVQRRTRMRLSPFPLELFCGLSNASKQRRPNLRRGGRGAWWKEAEVPLRYCSRGGECFDRNRLPILGGY